MNSSSPPDQTGAKNSSELRQTKRMRQLKNAIIVFNNRRSSMACVVRDISETGAKVRLNGLVDLPEEFELVLLNERKIVTASLSWFNFPDCGVVFKGPMRAATHL